MRRVLARAKAAHFGAGSPGSCGPRRLPLPRDIRGRFARRLAEPFGGGRLLMVRGDLRLDMLALADEAFDAELAQSKRR